MQNNWPAIVFEMTSQCNNRKIVLNTKIACLQAKTMEMKRKTNDKLYKIVSLLWCISQDSVDKSRKSR